ncbi:nickel-dependent hydrogenase large subunit [Solemya velesiana gill symbiont]|uniref:Ni,Fe-hydrogenase I large subunit n=1 Tax=Solemya velesiana gill symbiont TaxID=1918948 RepID=A0A1T2KSF8_9GAMM|nr:nickel-dependent hydrogenase large subunit [Solemya velesiana gill symbiont]OOZ35795.1 hypothetical protein BOW51_10330 [Solemya velesiana gill symbiont]
MQSGSDSVEGQITITLDWDGEHVNDVDITSSRPLQMPTIFSDKTVDYLLDTLPLLYSVCGTAQACAAVSACEQALGIDENPARNEGRKLLVLLETAKEHAWRIGYDWARLLGEPETPEPVARLIALTGTFRNELYPDRKPFMPGSDPGLTRQAPLDAIIGEFEQILEEHVFSISLDAWLALDSSDGLRAWASEGGSVAARFVANLLSGELASMGYADNQALPGMDAGKLDSLLASKDADALIFQPTWDGMTYETGPLNRVQGYPLIRALENEYGNGLLTRVVARLVELASIPAAVASGVACIVSGKCPVKQCSGILAKGRGVAQVEAARGRLVHRVVLDGEKVISYQILAPTEWNFHPWGVLAQGLAGLRANSEGELRYKAALLVNAIDPCVAYELIVS